MAPALTAAGSQHTVLYWSLSGNSFCALVRTKVSSSYHLCVESFSQLLFDSEVCTKSATAADFVYTSEMRVVKNIQCKDDRITSL